MSHHRNHHAPRRLQHTSLDVKRQQHSHRESAFAQTWTEANQPKRWLNYGYGVLQDLMVDQRDTRRPRLRGAVWRTIITNRDAMIAATVVQWLATNCGMEFLGRALRSCGYRIVRDEAWDAAEDRCPTCSGRDKVSKREGRTVCGWCGLPLPSKRVRELHRAYL